MKFTPIPKMNEDELERFMRNVKISGPGACWEWCGTMGTRDYGRFWIKIKQYWAHRVSYRHFVSSEDVFQEIDHKCRNHKCVNPSHLEAVTHKENVRRGNAPSTVTSRSKVCKRGHDLTLEKNLLPYYLKLGRTVCKPCEVMRIKKFQAKNRKRGALS